MLLGDSPPRSVHTPRPGMSLADELFHDSASTAAVSPSSEMIMADGGGVFSPAVSRANFRGEV